MEREAHLYTIPYKENQNCLQRYVPGKLRNTRNFSYLGAWPSQQNILLVSKVRLVPKTLLVNSSLSSRMPLSFPGGTWQLHHHVLTVPRSSSGAAPWSLQRGQFCREKEQPTQFNCLLESICHHPSHPVDFIPFKGYQLKLKIQTMLKCELSHESFSTSR